MEREEEETESLPPKPPIALPDDAEDYDEPDVDVTDVMADDEFIHPADAQIDPTIDDSEDDRG